MRKRYLAIVAGAVAADAGACDAPVGGRPAATAWRVLRRDASAAHGAVTTLELWPATGRKHQLRQTPLSGSFGPLKGLIGGLSPFRGV